jgi:deoxyribodipyrimidine photo-lyase
MGQVGLFWFTNDLRIDNNAALNRAAREVDKLICFASLPPAGNALAINQPGQLSANRMQFLLESLEDLNHSLGAYDQHLIVSNDSSINAIAQLITQHNISQVYGTGITGVYESRQWQIMTKRYPMIGFHQVGDNRIFDPASLPFQTENLPDSFSKFRRIVENLEIKPAVPKPNFLPPSPAQPQPWPAQLQQFQRSTTALFAGGETAASAHLHNYFRSGLASTYKQTRNGLDGMNYSTKFSPWLANGCLSPGQIIGDLRQYEQQVESNDSTYWIYFELLWREYFQYYADKHTARLFAFSGISKRRPTTSFYPQRFKKWCAGSTPYPIVNACMKQLNSTGYMSNRGRQLVASCLVHELGLDWRYGAAYMEQQLIDYDMASNWGNWQYLAGVGADPRGHRQFNLAKQTQTYDPDGLFIERWQGNNADSTLDYTDAADWPVASQ